MNVKDTNIGATLSTQVSAFAPDALCIDTLRFLSVDAVQSMFAPHVATTRRRNVTADELRAGDIARRRVVLRREWRGRGCDGR